MALMLDHYKIPYTAWTRRVQCSNYHIVKIGHAFARLHCAELATVRIVTKSLGGYHDIVRLCPACREALNEKPYLEVLAEEEL